MFLAGSCGYEPSVMNLFGKSMKTKILSKNLLLITSITAIVFTVAILFLAPAARGKNFYAKPAIDSQISQNPVDNKPIAPIVVAEQAIPALPVRLVIPKINVDVAVEQVGLTSGGAMDMPKDLDVVGWFNLGSRPGDSGNAVIAGHYGIKNGKGSTFDDLHQLRQGDKLSVEDNKGVTTNFVVQRSRRYDPDADASVVFVSSDGKAHLNLITCEGTWTEITKSYTSRLVVFTDKE